MHRRRVAGVPATPPAAVPKRLAKLATHTYAFALTARSPPEPSSHQDGVARLHPSAVRSCTYRSLRRPTLGLAGSAHGQGLSVSPMLRVGPLAFHGTVRQGQTGHRSDRAFLYGCLGAGVHTRSSRGVTTLPPTGERVDLLLDVIIDQQLVAVGCSSQWTGMNADGGTDRLESVGFPAARAMPVDQPVVIDGRVVVFGGLYLTGRTTKLRLTSAPSLGLSSVGR